MPSHNYHNATMSTTSMFECPRCDYTNKCFAVFLKHLNRKKPCSVIDGKEDVDPVEYGASLSDKRYVKKRFPCSDCGKKYSSPASLRMHKIRKHEYCPLPKNVATTDTEVNNADVDDEFEKILEDFFGESEPKPPIINPFGLEDIGHLLMDTQALQLARVLKDGGGRSMDERFIAVVRMIYDDPIRPHNKTFILGDDNTVRVNMDDTPGGNYKEPKSQAYALKMIKQRANTVMQNPLSFDDEPLAAFVREIGEPMYEELKEFTYKLDLGEDAEFEERISRLITHP